MQEKKWYKKKVFYIPVAIILGLLGAGASYATLLDKDVDDELNPDYYNGIDQDLFKKEWL
ncbi:hypothetical protein [uncultured Vagococcus sp.]|uniref:hypothetical protein n=1 Tax=uncultured Vagococcus sp. TaxID=189676 RepID=UPI0028D5D72F|nr:hypothetical protein [uncultured Vagococcus sp.]